MAGLRFDRNPAQFRELLDARFAAKASVAGRAHTAEWHLRFVVYGRSIDVANPRANLTGNAQATRRVASEYRGRQPVLAVIGDADGIGFVFGANDSDHGAETLV